jgi:hypothetical protein
MVRLAVADTSSPNNSNKTISLRDNALWFPSIPEDHLQFNKSHVKSTSTAVSGFRPLCCLLRDATNPAELSKVSVTSEVQTSEIESFETIGFDCHYGTGDTRRLGPSFYSPETTKTEGYTIKRKAKIVKDIITFAKNGELRRPKVSNYSKCLVSNTLITQIL